MVLKVHRVRYIVLEIEEGNHTTTILPKGRMYFFHSQITQSQVDFFMRNMTR